jgi:hypothetical protein
MLYDREMTDDPGWNYGEPRRLPQPRKQKSWMNRCKTIWKIVSPFAIQLAGAAGGGFAAYLVKHWGLG